MRRRLSELDSVYRRSGELSTVRLGEEAVLVPASRQPLDLGRCFRLNSVGAFVWEQIDGQRTVSEIARAVCREFAVEAPQAHSDLDEFFRELEQIGAVSAWLPGRDMGGATAVN